MYLGHYQTMRLSFEQIRQGQDPWVPLGNFMNDWYVYHADERERLVCEPLPAGYTYGFQRWAAFCAASVRWFCATYEVLCPSWVDEAQYVLGEPWYMDDPSTLWLYLRETTAPEFTQHNIFCGNRLYTNKYELDERGWPLKSHPVDLQQRRALVRAAAERARKKRAELERRVEEWAVTHPR
jgi:hypothetical protein